ncbi:unnamed protein product [Clavelina lepadiformis]|uniref:Coiled-coil domain-containing protein 62 n=1 Tax=Clavelina lepadiformis TaxID=159417 RepID=A0ABP0H4R6_CLALP
MMHPRFRSSPKPTANTSYDDERIPGHLDGSLSLSDMEAGTIAKQRHELQLLIGELKDRDRELNEMVAAHQKQLSAWERDRQRLVDLEQKNEKMECEIRKRNEQLRLLIQRLKVSECQHKNKDVAIEVAKTKLIETQKQISETTVKCQDLQSMNEVLNSSVTELSTKIGRLEAKEQEFITKLQLKDGDLVDAESHIGELKTKVHRLESELKQSKQDGATTRVGLEQQKAKYRQCRAELDKMSAEMATKTGEIITLRQELTKVRDEAQRVKRELYFAEEQLKRKEELIDLQKSKQDRADTELAQLRQLYERQQEELGIVQLNLETSQEMLAKQEERLNNLSNIDLEGFDCTSQTTNDLLEEVRRSTEEDTILSQVLNHTEGGSKSPQLHSHLLVSYSYIFGLPQDPSFFVYIIILEYFIGIEAYIYLVEHY